jgi:GDP-mannose 6-dehydrogenase
VDAPVLGAILPSNQRQIGRAIELVESTGRRRIGVLGLTFKPATDDVRESPALALVETLVGRGYQISVYDENVSASKLIGANRAFLERVWPHIAPQMRSSIEEVVKDAEVVVIANGSANFRRVRQLLDENQILIDLIGVAKGDRWMRGEYKGISW